MPRKSAKTAALEAENANLRAQIANLRSDSVEAPVIGGMERRGKMSGTVTVACKVPMGMRLQLQHKMSQPQPTGRTGASEYEKVEVNVFGGPVYHVFGPSMPVGHVEGYILPKGLEGGYALTHGIPAEFWAQWLEQNSKAPYVENGMIFALDAASTKDKAIDFSEKKSGLEPLSRDVDSKGRLKDPRVPKPASAHVARIAFDAERDAERGGRSLADAD